MDARDPDPTVPSPPEKVKNRNVSSQERRDIVLTLLCQSNMAIAKLSVDKDFCVYHSNNLLIFQFMFNKGRTKLSVHENTQCT